MQEFVAPEVLEKVARSLIDGAGAQGIRLRAFGGIGIRIHCPRICENGFGPRTHRDVDFVGDGSQTIRLNEFIIASGFRMVGSVHQYPGGELRAYRLTRQARRKIECEAHVYYGRLRFNHELPPPYFRDDERYTLPIVQLLLSKLGIVKMGRADVADIGGLLAEHDIVDDDQPETLQVRLLAQAWCAGCAAWPLAKTCLENVVAAKERVRLETGASRSVLDAVCDRLERLRTIMVRVPKSCCWKTRAAIGTSFLGIPIPYYDVVDPPLENG